MRCSLLLLSFCFVFFVCFFVCLFVCLLTTYLFYLSIYLSIYVSIIVIILLLLFFFLHILFKYARVLCIIVPYNDGSKAPIQLSGRGRSCLAFVRSEIFGLGIAPKEKLSHLFNPISIQE